MNGGLWRAQPLRHPGYIADRWYPTTKQVSSGIQAADTLYAYPYLVRRAVTMKALGVRVNTGVALAALLAGIYANDPLTGRPAGILGQVAAAIAATASSSSVSGALAANAQIPAGIVWIASLPNGSTQIGTLIASFFEQAELVGATSLGNAITTACTNALSKSQSYAGGLPASLAGSAWTDITTALAPHIAFQAA